MTSPHLTPELQDLAATAALSSIAETSSGPIHNGTPVSAAVESADPEDDDDEDDDEEKETDLVTDARRNWSHDVTLTLVKIWKCVCESHADAGRVARMQLVYDEFKDAVDCSNRSRKAVEDKLYTLKQMYHFIVKTSSTLHKPPTAENKKTPSWFLLTKEERRVVRSLHRIRIPSISLDVFEILDSVLNPPTLPGATAAVSSHQATVSAPENAHESHVHHLASESGSVEIVDNKRNWSNDVTLQLARAWRNVVHHNKDLRGALLSQRVYTEFMNVVGGSSRSRKAIEDKMHSMKEMYRFIRLYNAGGVSGGSKTLWFDLTKPDRRHIRNAHKVRVPNLTSEVYAELDAFMSDSVDATDNFPIGFSRLLAAQQNLSMAATNDPLPPAPVENGSVDVSPLDSALNATYDVMRRLADEESQLLPAATNQAPPPMSVMPPAKRPRLTNEPTTEPRLQDLFALQERAIAERRLQHAEQMSLLLEIVGLLRQQGAGLHR